jgi:hypothetical protein
LFLSCARSRLKAFSDQISAPEQTPESSLD